MKKRANRALALVLCLALLAGAAVYAAEPVWGEKCLTDVDGQANTEFFEFSQNWRNNIDPGKQECWLPGETARFGFRGTGLRVYASVNTQEIGGVLTSLVNDRVTIRIDGGEEQLLRTAPGEYAVDIWGNTAVFEVTGLTQGYHEAVITCGTSTTQFTSFYFWSTQVADGAMVPRPVWGEVVRADLDGAANSSVFDFSEYWRNSIVPGAQECWLNGQNVRFSFKGHGAARSGADQHPGCDRRRGAGLLREQQCDDLDRRGRAAAAFSGGLFPALSGRRGSFPARRIV